VLLVLGVALVAVGGLVLIYLFFLAGPVASREGTGLRGSLRRSYEAVTWTSLEIGVLLGIVIAILAGSVVVPSVIGPVGLAALPVGVVATAVVQAVAYDEARRLEEPLTSGEDGS
jgi:hypothetical protein